MRNFYTLIVTAVKICKQFYSRSQDFQRVGAPRGGSRISGWAMEGPKAPSEAR